MVKLILCLILLGFQCQDCTEEEFNGIYITLISEYQYNLILKAERGEIFLIDKKIKDYFFREEMNLSPEDLIRLLKKDQLEFITTSKDWDKYYHYLKYFCNKNQSDTEFSINEINYKSMKPIEMDGERFYYHVENVKIKVLKKQVGKTPLNIFYINPNLKLSDTAKTITLYLATEVKEY